MARDQQPVSEEELAEAQEAISEAFEEAREYLREEGVLDEDDHTDRAAANGGNR